MPLAKAIEILTLWQDGKYNGSLDDLLAAQKLGIEAMKGIKKVRKTFRPYVEALLPGETED